MAVARPARSPIAPPAVAMPAAYQAGGVDAAGGVAALDQWWRLFNDPVLDALEDEAFRTGPDALTSAARVLEARATRSAQTAQTLPTGSISGTASRQRTSSIGQASTSINPSDGLTDTLSANFNVSWEIDLFGRLAVARRVALADAAQARFNIEGVRASLAANVADAYFEARGLVIQLEDARETVRIQTDLLDVATRKAAAGAAPPDSVDLVAGQLAQARAQADDLDARLQTVRRTLLILVGRPLPQTADLTLVGGPPEVPPPPAILPADLLGRRPDIREAEARLRSELGTARLRHLAVFPTLTLLPGLGLSRTASPGVSFIPPSTLVPAQQISSVGFWNLGVGLTAPTLDIPKLLYQARAEDARARQAAIAYERTVRTAYGEAQNALITLAAGRQATTRLVDGETRSKRAYEASRRRYAAGLDDLTATLTAEQSWRSVRTALTSERVDTLRRAVQTYKALGGGWAATAAGPGGG